MQMAITGSPVVVLVLAASILLQLAAAVVAVAIVRMPSSAFGIS
jgi:hypothetical protein